jgi:hypothetical protein
MFLGGPGQSTVGRIGASDNGCCVRIHPSIPGKVHPGKSGLPWQGPDEKAAAASAEEQPVAKVFWRRGSEQTEYHRGPIKPAYLGSPTCRPHFFANVVTPSFGGTICGLSGLCSIRVEYSLLRLVPGLVIEPASIGEFVRRDPDYVGQGSSSHQKVVRSSSMRCRVCPL